MVDEEADYIDSVKDNTVDSFDIDTTTTVIRLTDGSLVLHSPAQATGPLIFEIARLGSTVSAIIAPNLQHWLGCASWAALFPQVSLSSLLSPLSSLRHNRSQTYHHPGDYWQKNSLVSLGNH